MSAQVIRHLIIAGLLGVLVWAGVAGERWQPALQTVLDPKSPVVVYFGTADAQYLVGERRWVRREEKEPATAINLLLQGPTHPDLIRTVPPRTRLLNLRVQDGVAWADFSSEIIHDHPGGSAGEILTVYAIVNTLTEFPEIRRVAITVEGRRLESLVGHMDLSMPLERAGDLIAGVRASRPSLPAGVAP